MSEAQDPAAAPAPCPVPISALPANFQKHVDPKAPTPLRMMGAKAMAPMAPKEMATALFMLTFDAAAAVRMNSAVAISFGAIGTIAFAPIIRSGVGAFGSTCF